MTESRGWRTRLEDGLTTSMTVVPKTAKAIANLIFWIGVLAASLFVCASLLRLLYFFWLKLNSMLG